MPMVIAHQTPVGVGLSQEDAAEDKNTSIGATEGGRVSYFNPSEARYQQGELERGRQQLAQEGQYQRGELGERQQEITEKAQQDARDIALRGVEIQQQARLRGQEMSLENAYRMAETQIRAENLASLAGYRDVRAGQGQEGIDIRQQGLLDRAQAEKTSAQQRGESISDEEAFRRATLGMQQERLDVDTKFKGYTTQLGTLLNQWKAASDQVKAIQKGDPLSGKVDQNALDAATATRDAIGKQYKDLADPKNVPDIETPQVPQGEPATNPTGPALGSIANPFPKPKFSSASELANWVVANKFSPGTYITGPDGKPYALNQQDIQNAQQNNTLFPGSAAPQQAQQAPRPASPAQPAPPQFQAPTISPNAVTVPPPVSMLPRPQPPVVQQWIPPTPNLVTG